MARNVAHTSASRSVDGANQGKNNVMERGGSVSANPVWSPGGAQSPTQRMDAGKYANQTGGYGETSPRMTPKTSMERLAKLSTLRNNRISVALTHNHGRPTRWGDF